MTTPTPTVNAGQETGRLFPGLRRYLRDRFGEEAGSATIELFPSARESLKSGGYGARGTAPVGSFSKRSAPAISGTRTERTARQW